MPRGQGELILVVDDEGSVRQITKQTLEAVRLPRDPRLGWRRGDRRLRPGEFGNRSGDHGYDDADDGRPATIQVLRKMNPDLPIIAASGLSANNHVTNVASLGVQHFLAKPYTTERVLQVLKKILAPRRLEAAERKQASRE
jgi:DNA-binding NtrC family response regulator